ncbi:zinc finger MYM-type protein 1-like [Xenia sp. Carnegie-2017]|uniref:zinc finger MYM-type protein 1-like n=1 Tax=Xenia sp. Carnegie-2017 TaxID=2897299 RepID=UPI001F03D4A5|nr:zinc finger MYM-type protein 1-like [Xenia sp. Carnegie-2017]
MSSTSGGGNRDRDKNRKYASGAAKRKAKDERILRESKVLSKMPKISELFPPKADEGSSELTAADEAMTTMAEAVEEPDTSDTSKELTSGDTSISTDNSDGYSCDLGLWPTDISDNMREHWAGQGSSQCRNSDADFSATSTRYEGDAYNRRCQKTLFTYTHELTKQQHPRNWLCYSPSKHVVFCFACKLMTDSIVFGKQGYNDWKRASQSIPRHEKSSAHRNAVFQLLQRSDAGCRIDSELVTQASDERNYWRAVLERVTETIRYFSERSLPFRGTDEIVGSPKNGNYLGTLELISMFDPFLAQHINRNANKGKGHTSYLSKTICEEFIQLMATRVRKQIFTEVKAAKYFSVCVDSTPDISHVDQLTCILRYVLPSGPVERFVSFLNIRGHSGKLLAERLLDYLKTNNINISDCRGQSYDNASNMSGKYNGMQAIIQQHCSLAQYIPCVAHSLNLVGQSSASCCQEASRFFNFLQRLYSFFAASTHRWKVLNDQLSSKRLPTVKRMSDTRWSARADATKALVIGYEEINAALDEIHDDEDEKPEAKNEANSLASDMAQLEIGILAALWHQIWQRFQRTSQILQLADQDLNTAVALYESLIEFVLSLRTRFEEFEAKGKELSECDQYKEEIKCVRKRNRRNDEPGSAPDLLQIPADKFRTGTFLVIIDSLDAELRKRLSAYINIAEKFGFLRKLTDLPAEDVLENAQRLQKAFSTDLEVNLGDELLQFSSFLNTEFVKRALDASHAAAPHYSSARIGSSAQPSEDHDIDVTSDDDDDIKVNVDS